MTATTVGDEGLTTTGMTVALSETATLNPAVVMSSSPASTSSTAGSSGGTPTSHIPHTPAGCGVPQQQRVRR